MTCILPLGLKFLFFPKIKNKNKCFYLILELTSHSKTVTSHVDYLRSTFTKPSLFKNWQPLTNENLVLSNRLFLGYKLYLRAGRAPSHRWPIQNKLNGIFSGSLAHYILSDFFKTLKMYCVYIMASCFVLLWDFYVYEHACLCICVSFTFSLALLFLFVCSILVWFAFYFILYYDDDDGTFFVF